jgi:hypothetical protein
MITITPADVTDAVKFLETYMTGRLTDGDFSEGALLRDLAIKAIAYDYAYLRATDEQIRARQSLLSITSIDTTDDSEAANDAADAIMSNWFASRKLGKYARTTAHLFLQERTDTVIPAANHFYVSSDVSFTLDNVGEDLLVEAEELVAQWDNSGDIIGYVASFPVVAEYPGAQYNIDPIRFTSFDHIDDAELYVETQAKASGGGPIETSTEMRTRGKTLAATRNLINARSCDATLLDKYPTLQALTVIGMGDVEMIRDLREEMATRWRMHVGAHQDIFVSLPLVEQTVNLSVGAMFARPDGCVCIFRDEVYTSTNKFTDPNPTTGKTLVPGMCLRIWDGFPQNARDYVIREVRDYELLVSEKVPFPLATDVAGTYVTWSAGVFAPNFLDVIPRNTSVTHAERTLYGETSTSIAAEGAVVLPALPIYKITSVTIADATDPDADPADGLVHFEVRGNEPPTTQVAPYNEYQVVVHNPSAHQSTRSFAELIVGPSSTPTKYDGKTVRVTFETLSGFSSIALFVQGRSQRISTQHSLVRGYHPAYLSMVVEYRKKTGATGTIDNAAVASTLLSYINGFDPTEVIDTSQVSDYLKGIYPNIGHVYPFTIYYEVHVPDGRVVHFSSDEDVTVPHDPTKLATKQLSPGSAINGLDNPVTYGISDDTLRYVARSRDLTIQERA